MNMQAKLAALVGGLMVSGTGAALAAPAVGPVTAGAAAQAHVSADLSAATAAFGQAAAYLKSTGDAGVARAESLYAKGAAALEDASVTVRARAATGAGMTSDRLASVTGRTAALVGRMATDVRMQPKVVLAARTRLYAALDNETAAARVHGTSVARSVVQVAGSARSALDSLYLSVPVSLSGSGTASVGLGGSDTQDAQVAPDSTTPSVSIEGQGGLQLGLGG